MSKRWSVGIVAAVCVLSLGSLNAFAQVITGTIYGVVLDESKAAIPGATVTVKNMDTGVTHQAVTDDQGRYRVGNLALGNNYRVDAELQGFKTAVRTGIGLTVGQEAAVDFTLGVGSLSESVEVTSAAPLVETSKSQLADLVDQRQVASLPLNSRSYTDLALLEPGVMTTSKADAVVSGTSGGGVRLAISGARPTNTGFYVDGLDIKDAFGRTPASAAGTTLGVDTIREFQVLTSSFSAQYGGSGGVLNAVTKSGTNQIHGDAFYFRRDAKWDAANPFDVSGVAPPFTRDQPGFTVGGPIKKDHTFFFVSYEHLRQRQTNTTTINTPGPAIRAGITTAGTFPVDPISAKLMAAMQPPNGTIFSNGIGQYTYGQPTQADEDYFMGKVDQQVSSKDNFFVRYTSDIASNINPLPFPGFTEPIDTKNRFMIGEYDRIMTSALLNTVRFSINKSVATLANTSTGIDPSLSFIPGRVAQQLTIPGLSSWGNDGINDRAYYLTSYQFSDRLSYTKGKHAVVGGFDYIGTSLAGYSASRIHGRLTYQTLQSFLIGKPATWEFLVPGTGSDPGPEDTSRRMRQDQFSFYAQDDFKIRSNVTINAGLRWEFVNGVREVDGSNQISNLVNPLDPAVTMGSFMQAPKANFGPRVGFAWDIRGDGKTSLKAGAGMFYQPMNYAVWQIVAYQNPPYFIRAQIAGPPWPPTTNVPAGSLPPSNPSPIESNPNNPYYIQMNTTLSQQLRGDMVVSVSYTGSRGRNLASGDNLNPFTYTTLADGTKFWGASGTQVRQNPNFAAEEYRLFNLMSNYNSMQIRFQKRFGAGMQLQSGFTFAKNMDNGSETQGTAVMDPTNPLLDYGLSDYDIRKLWTFNYIYELPFFHDRRDVVGYVFGGWQINGLFTASDGFPLRVIDGFNQSRDGNVMSSSANNDRPNLAAGADPNPVIGDGRNPTAYASVSSFVIEQAGTHGNLARNTLIGPGILQLDGSFVKNIYFGGGSSKRIEFRLEFFNLLNRNNLGSPNATAFVSATGPNPAFGVITATSTPSRQTQIGLKFLF
jgi:hypothetical protein